MPLWELKYKPILGSFSKFIHKHCNDIILSLRDGLLHLELIKDTNGHNDKFHQYIGTIPVDFLKADNTAGNAEGTIMIDALPASSSLRWSSVTAAPSQHATVGQVSITGSGPQCFICDKLMENFTDQDRMEATPHELRLAVCSPVCDRHITDEDELIFDHIIDDKPYDVSFSKQRWLKIRRHIDNDVQCLARASSSG